MMTSHPTACPRPRGRRLAAAGLFLSLAAAIMGAAAPASARERDEEGRGCHPHRTAPGQQKQQNGSGGLPEFPGPVTTLCVGEHPTDVAIAPDWNLAVVANRDSRSLSLVNLRSLQIDGTVSLPARPTRVAADGGLAAAVSPWSHNLFVVNLAAPGFRVTSVPLGYGSVDVALDATLQLAVLLDKHHKRVRVVNLGTPGSPGIIGSVDLPFPANGIALDKGRGWVLATSHKHGGLLLRVDYATNPSAPTVLGVQSLSAAVEPGKQNRVDPEGIAVDETADKAIIVDRGGTLVPFDLRLLSPGPAFPVAKRPLLDVALDPTSNMAVAVGENDDAFIVDLAAQVPIFHVSVGRKPVGTAVNGNPATATAGRAAVVNQDEDSLSVFDLPSRTPSPGGVPTITRLSPDSVTAGSPNFTLTIQGTGFTPDAVVRFANTIVKSRFVSSTQLTAAIPSRLVLSAGTVPVTVTVGSQTSLPASFTILPPPNPAPVITPPLLPDNVVAGAVPSDGFLLLTINGDQFLGTSQVTFGGCPLPISSVTQSGTLITASIPGSCLTTPGTVLVTVTNPPPGGGVASAPFTIKPRGNPTGVSTATVDVGAPTSSVAVDMSVQPDGMAVVTRFGTITGAIGNTAVRLENLTGSIPGNPPTPVGTTVVGYSPMQAAVNSLTHIALISNLFADASGDLPYGTVSFLNLATGVEEARTSLAARPEGVAVDPIATAAYPAGIGLVGSRLDGSLTVADLSTHAPIGSPFTLGAPTGIAINPGTHLAVIADESTSPGSVYLVDLTNPAAPRRVARIRVGNSPARVAISATRNLALATNQDDNTVSVIDLSAGKVIAVLSVGQQPFGVAIDDTLGIAAVVNRMDATLSLIDLRPAMPVVMPLTINLLFVPTEVAAVPGTSGNLRLLATDVASNNVGVVEISGSVLP